MRLLLMRHAEAENVAATDEQRNLTELGLQQANRAGQWLAGQGLAIELICHSSYQRVRQTMAGVCAALGDIPGREMAELAPSGDTGRLLAELDTCAAQVILCITHQPLVGNLRNYLVEGSEQTGYAFSPASIALLECDYLAAGCASMRWFCEPCDFD
jgi:phosphohistidine phosphatase